MKLESMMSRLFVGLCIALSTSAMAACSSDNSAAPPSYGCANKGPCANDPMPSSDESAACQSLTSDALCGAAFNAYAMCAYGAAKCDDAGMSDPNADSTSSECVSEYAAYTTCLGNETHDGGAQ